MGQYVSIAASDGSGRFDAYLALPASGKGPGVVIGQEIFGVNANMRAVADLYAEEGYVALVPDLFWRLQPGVDLGYDEAAFAKAIELFQRIDLDAAVDDIAACIEHLRHGMGIEALLDEAKQIKGRLVLHFAEQDAYCPQQARDAILPCLRNLPKTELYLYPGVDHAFARVGGMHFDKPAYLMAHERSIAALKREIGPNFDLSALWDEHVRHEFDTRDVAATMATMVAEPYVNHVPTLTGGVGQRELSRFYRHHFIHGNPPDMTLTPISRTVGALQVVDEFVMRFTHSCEIDWLLPGVPPTGRFVEIPMLGVVRFRGDRLYHEHIYWDQAGVLVQIGLLDPQGLPVAGVESARKLLDESLPSNRLMARWAASEGLGL
ncbi:TPA: dienelactone hydrolase family protein [Pseudomonas aeruginosa]|nr:dienelactone hydrolase family protein [Pseudomonas aeruginosa]